MKFPVLGRRMRSTGRALAIVALAAMTMFILGCWLKIIVTPYYTQVTSYYCGAASAQMILNSEKLGIYVPSQATLYNYIHSHNQCGGWASDPKGLRDVLNYYANAHTPPAYFVFYTPSNQNDGVKKLAYTIDHYGVPPAVLIYGCAHWIVVRGVFTDVQPTSAPSYSIYGFYVNDPWYGSTSLGENKYVDIAHWKSNYFTGCSWCGATGTTYISVVDPDPPKPVTVVYPEVKPRRAKILSGAAITEQAQAYLRQFEAQKDFAREFAEGLEVMRRSRLGEPVLIRRSDQAQNAYYIVPLLTGEAASGALLLDAYSGQIQEATYVKEALPSYLPSLGKQWAKEMFLKKLPGLTIDRELAQKISTTMPKADRPPAAEMHLKTFAQLKVRPQDVVLSQMELMWEPSAESQNPYYPVWRVTGTVAKVRGAQVLGFLNAKGEIFARLTPVRSIEMKGGGF